MLPVIIRLPQSLPTCLSHYPPASVITHLPQSLPTCLSHHPAFSFSVIIRLDRIIHTAEHHFPSSATSPVLTRRVRLDRSIFNLDCPIKSGNDIKQKQSQPAPSQSSIRFNFLTVIIRLDRIIHAAEHHFPSSAASPVLTRRVRLDRSIFNLDCPIKSGNDIKGIK